MSIEVEPNDWASLDPFWSAYTQNCSIAQGSASERALDTTGMAGCWEGLELWWPAYTDSSFQLGGSASTRALLTERSTMSWDELDPWWDVYTETGHETAIKIADLLNRSNEEWKQSPAPFDSDPLASALTRDQGPLLPHNEEGWSNWFAQLLRPSEALVTELFDTEIDKPPAEVIREAQLTKPDGGFRRPDILVFHADRGISIEVKLGDENYKKTNETARLTERHYDNQEWVHVLLLPSSKKGRLESIIDADIESRADGRFQIEWDDPGPVLVLHWRDVTAAIRTLLRRGEVVDDHWAANAYLFCAAVEQQVMNFQPRPAIAKMLDPASVADTIQPIVLAGTLGEQLTYLRARRNP